MEGVGAVLGGGGSLAGGELRLGHGDDVCVGFWILAERS